MRQKMQLESGSELFSFSKGSPHPMRVTFREVHPFNLWLWFELYSEPAREDKEALKELLRSWFVVGKFGGYNSMNLQAFHKTEFDASWMDYNVKDSDTALEAYLHSLHDIETKGHWARARLDMGSADELAFDILINMLQGFNSSVLGIRTLYIGGQNSDWPVPDVNEVPETDIDPMRVNPVAEEDLDDFLDDGTLPAGSFPRERADSLEGMDDKQRAKLDSLVERLNLSGFTVDSSDPRGGSSSSSSRGKPPLA